MGKLSGNLSKELHWYLDTLRIEFDVEVAVDDIAIEAVELGTDEVEDFFVPVEVLEAVPDLLLYEIMLADDAEGNVWVGAVAFYPDSPDWCLEIVTKNGDMVWRKPLLKGTDSRDNTNRS